MRCAFPRFLSLPITNLHVSLHGLDLSYSVEFERKQAIPTVKNYNVSVNIVAK